MLKKTKRQGAAGGNGASHALVGASRIKFSAYVLYVNGDTGDLNLEGSPSCTVCLTHHMHKQQSSPTESDNIDNTHKYDPTAALFFF